MQSLLEWKPFHSLFPLLWLFFSFLSFFLLLLRLLQDCIGSIQVNSAMPNRFADCHRLKKGELENTKETKKNIGFFPSEIRSYCLSTSFRDLHLDIPSFYLFRESYLTMKKIIHFNEMLYFSLLPWALRGKWSSWIQNCFPLLWNLFSCNFTVCL